ncbi:acid alpha glucosidase relate [Anaeramoeba ignava]|uniref:Acid alpha glucosidase relate n=1 Tax=Anaeramoeba ignava TaxID=1746090 RepID=A0A9Q0LVV8_ANAIG|nr:acid alpha glucosidase relate [Anaeramoeba ignava]
MLNNGNDEDVNLYGVQPFYIELREETHLFHGVFILNSNAMDVTLNPDHLTYRTIGGILDIYIFTGVSIDDVISQYTDLVGKPPMIPYFALGFHQCRWGYKNLNECKTVVEQYKAHQLPLDTFWMDIDYMDAYKDFTFDPVNYPQEEVKEFSEQLHEDNQHYVIILDPGIKVEEGYAPYDDGISDGIFIINADTKLPYTAPVWPGECNFPDFTNPKTYSYWSKFIQQIFDEGIILDGLWVDMNEPDDFDFTGNQNDKLINSFIEKKEDEEELSESSESKKVERDSINLPYVPGGVNLNYRTVNLSSIQNTSTSFNLHSMYGFMEAKATASILIEIMKKRSFVLSRSTYAGHGHHAFHWLGDNYSTYKSMAGSIQGILNMNMFGIPLVGADICGFLGDTTAELCARWIELGSFYPFSRDHNADGMKSQELYALGDQVTNISRNVLLNRYSLIPYYYTLFYYSHEIGTPIWRALVYDFPEDPNTYSIDKQFLVGNALLVTPVLEEGATSVEGYFPNSDWYDYWSGEKILTKNSTLKFGKNLTLDAPLDKINVAIRGGYIIPKQEPALTTAESRNNSFEILAAIDSETLSASGKLFFDDGISLDTSQNSSRLTFELTYSSGLFYFETSIYESNYDLLNHVLLDKMTFYGVDSITTLWVNNIKYPFEYDSTLKVLRIKGLNLSLNERFQIIWKTN